MTDDVFFHLFDLKENAFSIPRKSAMLANLFEIISGVDEQCCNKVAFSGLTVLIAASLKGFIRIGGKCIEIEAVIPVRSADQRQAMGTQAVEREVKPYLAAAPGAVAASKALARSLGPRIDDAVIEDTIERLADTWEQAEAREGVSAFFDKRQAKWVC